MELVSNSLKHAFARGSKGEIHVICRRDSPDTLRLTAKDDGAGMSSDYDLHTAETIGMQLVTSLVQQLEGKITFHQRAIGAQFDVLIPYEPIGST